MANNIETIKVIRHNHRFRASQALWHDQVVFCKEAQSGVTGKSEIAREVVGLQAFADFVQAQGTDAPFAVPKLLYHDDTTLITEYVDGVTPTLARVSDEFFVQSFVKMDKYFRLQQRQPTRLSQPDANGNFYLKTLEEEALHVAVDSSTKALIHDATHFLSENQHILEARPMHADFTENNLLYDGQKYWLIDFESFRDNWPRWYDVVNFTYNREIDSTHLSQRMQKIRRDVIEHIGTDATTYLEITYLQIMRALSLMAYNVSIISDIKEREAFLQRLVASIKTLMD